MMDWRLMIDWWMIDLWLNDDYLVIDYLIDRLIVLNMTGFVLKFTGFVGNMTGFVLNTTEFVLRITGFVLSMTKLVLNEWIFPKYYLICYWYDWICPKYDRFWFLIQPYGSVTIRSPGADWLTECLTDYYFCSKSTSCPYFMLKVWNRPSWDKVGIEFTGSQPDPTFLPSLRFSWHFNTGWPMNKLSPY